MGRSRVAVVSTHPETVIADIRRALELVGLRQRLARADEIWIAPERAAQPAHPGMASPPWQLDGLMAELEREHRGAEACTLATAGRPAPQLEEVRRGWGLREGDPRWERLPAGFDAPQLERRAEGEPTWDARARGRLLMPLPVLKHEPGWTGAGALWTLARSLLPDGRWGSEAQEAGGVAEALELARSVGKGIVALMDGAVAGGGTGRRARRSSIQNVLLASADPVALDAVALRLRGGDPEASPLLRRCAERGLGRIAAEEIEQVGQQERLELPVRMGVGDPTHARGGWFDRLHERLLWEPLVGRPLRRHFERTPWGRLRASYRRGERG